jgi:hypothetical protein
LMIPEPGKMAAKSDFKRALFKAVQANGANVFRIPVHPFWSLADNQWPPPMLLPDGRWLSYHLGTFSAARAKPKALCRALANRGRAPCPPLPLAANIKFLAPGFELISGSQSVSLQLPIHPSSLGGR